MTPQDIQAILKGLYSLKESVGVLQHRTSSVEEGLKGLRDEQVVLHNLVVDLAENQAALQENIGMFIVHMSRHDADIDTLKQKVGV